VNTDAWIRLLEQVRPIEGWLYEDEAELLMRITERTVNELPMPQRIVEIGSYCGRSTIVLGGTVRALDARARVYAIDPHLGEVGAIDGTTGVRVGAPTLERFLENIRTAGLDHIVEAVRQRSTQVDWHRPVSFLFVDGLHDYLSVRGDVAHFAPWVVPGGYLALHDHSEDFPGVRACVRELLATGVYRWQEQVGSLVVVQKAEAGTRSPGAADRPPGGASSVRSTDKESYLMERERWSPSSEQRATPPSADLATAATHVEARMAALVGGGKQVLQVAGAASLSRLLKAQLCTLSVLTDLPAADFHDVCDRLVPGHVEDPTSMQALRADRFDVVVVPETLARVRDPGAVVQPLLRLLDPTGALIVSVPNAAHLSVRLCLTAGRSPYESGVLSERHARLYTRQSLLDLLEQSGLLVGSVESFPMPVPPLLAEQLGPESESLLRAADADPDASAGWFVVEAYPLPEGRFPAFHSRIRSVLAREAGLERERMQSAEMIRRLEDEIRSYQTQVEVRDDTIQTLRTRAARRDEVVQAVSEQLEQCRRDLLDRDASIQGLTARVTQLEPLQGHVQALEAHVEALLGSKSMRVTAPLRALRRVIGRWL
jgi:hypothetical protein